MADVVTREVRSRMMSGIRGKNTQPEMIVRRFLHGRGFRYRLHDKALPGAPDLVLPRYRAVVFVHGCYWHRHKGCKYATSPTSNVDFWDTKFAGNVRRDRDAVNRLRDSGWRVIILWECGLRQARGATTLDWLPDAIRKGGADLIEWPEVE
jgi:DNA mismatch endonuclease, patch repair protein